jgi:hypothetical protein
MTQPMKNRETITGAVTLYTNPLDVSNFPLLVLTLVVYAMSGTTPSLTIQIQTSDDLETWMSVGSSFNLAAAGMAKSSFTAQTDVYGRYVRAQVVLAGTSPLANYSLFLNAFPST